jgi:uncharacterized membrane protein
MSDQREHHSHASGHQARVRYWGAWRHVFDRVQDDEHLGNNRLEAFSDGVLAIAITLLILDVRVPRVDDADTLLHELRHEWPAYLGYVLSFVTIGILWANHHTMFRFIRRSNHVLLMLNTLWLLAVAFIPFATSLLSEYIGGTYEEQRIAVLVYGGTYFVIAILFHVVWLYGVYHEGLLDPGADPRALTAITGSYQLGLLLYAFALVLAYFAPVAAVVLYALLALYFALPGAGRSR